VLIWAIGFARWVISVVSGDIWPGTGDVAFLVARPFRAMCAILSASDRGYLPDTQQWLQGGKAADTEGNVLVSVHYVVSGRSVDESC